MILGKERGRELRFRFAREEGGTKGADPVPCSSIVKPRQEERRKERLGAKRQLPGREIEARCRMNIRAGGNTRTFHVCYKLPKEGKKKDSALVKVRRQSEGQK